MKKIFITGSIMALGLIAMTGKGVYAIETSGINNEGDLISCLTNASATCTLGGDISLTKAVLITGDINLNLGNYKISEGASFDHSGWGILTVTNGASLAINGTDQAGIFSDTAYAAVRMTEGETYDAAKVASLTVNGGTLSGLYYGITGNGTRHNTEITINGGKVVGTKAGDNTGIYHPQRGVLTINGGVVTGDTGIAIKSGILNIEGGEIIATGSDARPVDGYSNGINIAGAAIQIESSTDYSGDIALNFHDGKIISERGVALYEYIGRGENTQVSNVDIKNVTMDGGTGAYVISEQLNDSDVWANRYAAGSVVTENTKTRLVVVANMVETEGLTETQNVIVEEKTALTDDEADSISALNIDGLNIVGIYDISVLENGDLISETDNEITFTLKLGRNLAAGEGYSREWYMVGIHNGVAQLINGEVNEANGTVTFRTKKFSTYTLGYTEVALPVGDEEDAIVDTEATESADGDTDKTSGSVKSPNTGVPTRDSSVSITNDATITAFVGIIIAMIGAATFKCIRR